MLSAINKGTAGTVC